MMSAIGTRKVYRRHGIADLWPGSSVDFTVDMILMRGAQGGIGMVRVNDEAQVAEFELGLVASAAWRVRKS